MGWKFADARNRFSELVNSALADGPQRVSRRDDVVIVLSEADYLQLQGKRPNLIDYLLNGPDVSDLDVTRDRSPIRDAPGLR